jgi:hypothetical protein
LSQRKLTKSCLLTAKNMSIFDPESMLFQTDWRPLQEWFNKRAAEAGHSMYEHSETISVRSAIDADVAKAAEDLGRSAGESIRKIFDE